MNKKNLQNLLNKFMYKDTCDVYRAVRTKIGRTDDFDRTFELVYEQIPCHLAQYGKELSAHRDDTSQKITSDLRITYDPEYQIQTNDLLKINHQGQFWELVAGEQFNYATHSETSVRRRKEGKQL